ncbi:MAG: hypothetical protein JW787_16900 [Sedimentisphaerales bacterium]|nr:hypothetical protein [Sedimentisphaerales bacterium]
MENSTSEQQLKQLLDEGKINEEEYQQLLSSINKPKQVNTKIPGSLKIVGWLFIFFGIISLFDFISSILNNRHNYNLGVICLFIGYGLLKRYYQWRIVALVFLWFCFISLPLVSMLYLNEPYLGFSVSFFGERVSRDPLSIFVVNLIVIVPLALIYRILIKPEIKALFKKNDN